MFVGVSKANAIGGCRAAPIMRRVPSFLSKPKSNQDGYKTSMVLALFGRLSLRSWGIRLGPLIGHDLRGRRLMLSQFNCPICDANVWTQVGSHIYRASDHAQRPMVWDPM